MKKSSKKNTSISNDNINYAKLGRTFYDILEVNRDKIISNIASKSNELNLNKEELQEISNIITLEIETSKSWGYDSIVKILK